MREEMSRAEKRVYNYIVAYRCRTQVSPSMRDIMNGLDLNSVSTIQKHILSLTEKGWLSAVPGTARSYIPYEEAENFEEERNAV